MISNIPDIKVPIIKNGTSNILSLRDEFKNKRLILFGVPGAFTPTCSEKHLPGYIKLYDSFKKKYIDEIYCLAVNDHYVMKSWLISYSENHYIKGIADGNAEISKYYNLITDKSKNFMGYRSTRFGMFIENNQIKSLQWHSYEVQNLENNKDVTLIASSEVTKYQIFKYQNHAYGIQFHIEIKDTTVHEWGCVPEYKKALEDQLGDGALEKFDQSAKDNMSDMNNYSKILYNNFKKLL